MHCKYHVILKLCVNYIEFSNTYIELKKKKKKLLKFSMKYNNTFLLLAKRSLCFNPINDIHHKNMLLLN